MHEDVYAGSFYVKKDNNSGALFAKVASQHYRCYAANFAHKMVLCP